MIEIFQILILFFIFSLFCFVPLNISGSKKFNKNKFSILDISTFNLIINLNAKDLMLRRTEKSLKNLPLNTLTLTIFMRFELILDLGTYAIFQLIQNCVAAIFHTTSKNLLIRLACIPAHYSPATYSSDCSSNSRAFSSITYCRSDCSSCSGT